MFSTTAYEAYYTYIGMYLHQASIEIITSESILLGLLLLILGATFLVGTWRYFSKYMPFGFRGGRTVGISFFIKVIACFLIGVSLLRVNSQTSVKDYNRNSWHNNSYISSRYNPIQETYKVSFIFDLLTRSAEEISAFGSKIVDRLFATTNSQLEAPSAFYKAILYAGSQTIEDPALRDKIDVYTDSCFDKILPMLGMSARKDKIDEFFGLNGVIDQELKHIPITLDDGSKINCLTLKNLVRSDLWSYAERKGAKFYRNYSGKYSIRRTEITETDERNLIASNALVNHYLAQTEDSLGIQKGSEVRGTLAKIIHGWSRFWSWDGFLSTLGQRDQVGAALTAERAEKFSEYLQRAPHLKGMVKMFLIFLFPWLIFFVIAGRWKVIIAWFALYVSVLLWTPIWTLLYHLMTSIAVSNDLMMEWGEVSDGISLYSASFVTAKLYQFYALYSWLQILVGPLPTLILGYGLFSSFLTDSQTEQAPQVVTDAKDIGVGAATGGSSGAASAIARKV
ncbi:MAG: hypothetical protein AB8G05_09960 [Oligoflexales bacterium]